MWDPYIIAVDLDGTLATYEKGQYPEIGELNQHVAKALLEHLEKPNTSAVIITARIANLNPIDRKFMINKIHNWLTDHELPFLTITDTKHPDIDEYWDDRAIRVNTNGDFCKECNNQRGN